MHSTPLFLILISVRLTRLTVHILGALAVSPVYPALTRLAQRRFMQWWSAGLLNLLNVHCNAHGQPPAPDQQARLLVANHISWLDIFAVNVMTPAFFVAKAEVREWPVLGWLVQCSGTLFISRRQRSDVARVNQRMAGLMQQGNPVALFAQGTSTLPDQPLLFHASLLQSAVMAEALVQPVCIFYHDEQGQPHQAVAFVGDTSFIQSLWRIVCTPCIQVTVSYLAPVTAAGQNRRTLAAITQCAVNTALEACMNPVQLAVSPKCLKSATGMSHSPVNIRPTTQGERNERAT